MLAPEVALAGALNVVVVEALLTVSVPLTAVTV
jgi:hypothetical protein